MKIRSFLAFDLSKEIKENVGVLIQKLSSQAKGVKWTEPEQLHVTLKFLGSIDVNVQLESIGKCIDSQVQKVQSVSVECRGLGCFPKWENPKVLWVGLKGDLKPLNWLQQNLEEAFEKIGFPKEERAFQLHLTLGRVKFLEEDPHWLKTMQAFPETESFGSCLIDHVTLYKSQLTKRGSIYTALKEFPFSVNE